MVFFLPAAAFFRGELRARKCFFEQHNNNKNTQTTRQAVLVLARSRRSGGSSSTRFKGMVFLVGCRERFFGRGFSSGLLARFGNYVVLQGLVESCCFSSGR